MQRGLLIPESQTLIDLLKKLKYSPPHINQLQEINTMLMNNIEKFHIRNEYIEWHKNFMEQYRTGKRWNYFHTIKEKADTLKDHFEEWVQNNSE